MKGINSICSGGEWILSLIFRPRRIMVRAGPKVKFLFCLNAFIENQVYHKLCLLYKGELSLENLTDPEFSEAMNDALAYGIGNWHFYNGEKEKAKNVFQKILDRGSWASFGYIAAESDFARNYR